MHKYAVTLEVKGTGEKIEAEYEAEDLVDLYKKIRGDHNAVLTLAVQLDQPEPENGTTDEVPFDTSGAANLDSGPDSGGSSDDEV